MPLLFIILSWGSVTCPLHSWRAPSPTPPQGTFSPAHLRQSLDFIARIRGVSSTSLRSLDVETQFTDAPLDGVLAFVRSELFFEDSRFSLPLRPSSNSSMYGV